MATKKTASSGTRKTAAKKAPAKKASAEETGAKKTSAKKAPGKRTVTKSTSNRGAKRSESSQGNDSSGRGDAPRAEAGRKLTAPKIAAMAAQQLLQLTGREVEGVTGLQRTDDGWVVEVEVVEVRRIPETTDVLALYELTVDSDGDLEGYRRLRRYGRGAAGQERD
jgi:hypothetical protein